METILKAEKIIKTYHDGDKITPVLKGIDLSFPSGSFFSITGKSGTGKSTLLYSLSLLDKPTSGEIFLGKDNIPANTLSTKKRVRYRLENFGFVFQHYALIPEMLAWENVAVPMLMLGESKDVAKDRAVEVLNQLGLGERFDHLPSQLSGGESQRVSIARSIAHKPKILFADEPTANLDTERSKQVIDIFKQLNKEGQSIVMVTHEEEYAREAKKMIVIQDGKIIKEEKLRK